MNQPREVPMDAFGDCRPGSDLCPRLTHGLPGIGGAITGEPEDFRVDEIPSYTASGSGDHWMVRIRKRNLSTPHLCRLLARSSHCSERDIGAAGRKDTRAITTQWLSLPVEPILPDDDRVEFLEMARHGNKLRRGHLKANAFEIKVASVHEDTADRLPALFERLRNGVPNYYGVQRFGRAGAGADESLELFRSGRRSRKHDLRFATSIIQAAYFNRWLGRRIHEGILDTVLPGDILKKRETGGLFTSDNATVDQGRMDALELDVTGPMYGPKMRYAEETAGERELILRDAGPLTEAHWAQLARFGKGSRRVARMVPTAVSTHFDNNDLWLKFTLPAGAYATVFISELTHG